MNSCVLPGQCNARLLMFMGGPGTVGPGKVVGEPQKEEIRSHKVKKLNYLLLFTYLLLAWSALCYGMYYLVCRTVESNLSLIVVC